jgi:diketogulonate reductase-like aldo/keto reductase
METSTNNSINNKTVKLNNGLSFPLFGLGTNKKTTSDLIYQAIKDGVRLIDTAFIYQNEEQVGEGIQRALKDNIVKREDLFILTKLAISDKKNPEEAIKKQLNLLKLDYVDLYLDHWPISIQKPFTEQESHVPTHVLWKQLESLVKKGYTKSIGVSNYNVQLLMDILSYAEIKPVVNEIELHPYNNQKNLKYYCDKVNIQLVAYGPLVKGTYVKSKGEDDNIDLLNEDIIIQLSKKYNTTPGCIALNWSITQNITVIPSSNNNERIKENLQSLNFNLTKEEIEQINKLNRNRRFCSTTDWESLSYLDIFA